MSSFIRAHRNIVLFASGISILSFFVVLGAHAPALYEAARAQMEGSVEAEKQYDDTENQRRHVENLKEQYSNRERELKNNFRGMTLDMNEVNSRMAQWKSGISELESLIGNEELWNRNQDFHYDLQQPVDDAFSKLYAQQSYQQIARQIKDREQEGKNMQRQVDELRRNLKGTSADFSTLQGYVDGFKAELEEIRREYEQVNSDDPDLDTVTQGLQQRLGDLNEDFSQLFYDEINVFQEQSNRANAKKEAERFLKEASRAVEKDWPRQIKEFEKKGLDVSELKAILAEKQRVIEKVKSLVAGDFESQEYWDIVSYENGDVDQRFWDIANGYQEDQNAKRQEKDAARQEQDAARVLKDKGRVLNDMERELKRAKNEGSLGEVLQEAKSILERMRAALAEKDYDTFWSEQSDFDMRSGDFRNALNERTMQQSRTEELKGMDTEIRRFREAIGRAQAEGTIDAETAARCFAYADEADAIWKAMQEAVARGEEGAEETFGQKMQAIGEAVENVCTAVTEEMNRSYGEGQYGAPQPYRVPPAAPEITEDMLRYLGDGLANQVLERIMNAKTALLDEIATLETRVRELQTIAAAESERLADIQARIAAHHFVSDEGDAIRERLAQFMAEATNLSSAAVKEEVQKLEGEVAEAIGKDTDVAYEEGYIPFKDTAFGDWFTAYVAMLKQRGWTKGTGTSGGREYNPGGHLNIADTITFIGRAYGIDAGAIPASRIGQDLPAYAWDAAGTLENIGVPLDAIFAGDEAGDMVTRAQVARLIAAAFRLPPGDADFPDIGLATDEERAAIGAVAEVGIMTGQGDGAFGVKQKLNRAEMAAILARIAAVPEHTPEAELEAEPDATPETVPATTPDIVTIRGRWISHFTQEPLADTVVLTWDGQTRRSVTTDQNGAFAITADPMTLPKSFGTWPPCHEGLGFALSRTANNSFSVNVNISGYIGSDRSFSAIGNEVNLGDTPFWPAVNIALTSDTPVKFRIESEKESGAGNSLYKTEHRLSNSIPLTIPVRITVTDQNGTSTTSPSLTLPQDHGCTPVTLAFSQGEFTWK